MDVLYPGVLFWYANLISVLVSFMCQLDWFTGNPDIWLNIVSGCISEDISQ